MPLFGAQMLFQQWHGKLHDFRLFSFSLPLLLSASSFGILSKNVCIYLFVICLPVCLPACPRVCPSVCLVGCLSDCLDVWLLVGLLIHVSQSISIYTICFYVHIFKCLGKGLLSLPGTLKSSVEADGHLSNLAFRQQSVEWSKERKWWRFPVFLRTVSFQKVGCAMTEAIFLTANVWGHSMIRFAWSCREPYPSAKTLMSPGRSWPHSSTVVYEGNLPKSLGFFKLASFCGIVWSCFDQTYSNMYDWVLHDWMTLLLLFDICALRFQIGCMENWGLWERMLSCKRKEKKLLGTKGGSLEAQPKNQESKGREATQPSFHQRYSYDLIWRACESQWIHSNLNGDDRRVERKWRTGTQHVCSSGTKGKRRKSRRIRCQNLTSNRFLKPWNLLLPCNCLPRASTGLA